MINLTKPVNLMQKKGLTLYEYNTNTNVLSKAIIQDGDITVHTTDNANNNETPTTVTVSKLKTVAGCCYMQCLNLKSAVAKVTKTFNIIPNVI